MKCCPRVSLNQRIFHPALPLKSHWTSPTLVPNIVLQMFLSMTRFKINLLTFQLGFNQMTVYSWESVQVTFSFINGVKMWWKVRLHSESSEHFCFFYFKKALWKFWRCWKRFFKQKDDTNQFSVAKLPRLFKVSPYGTLSSYTWFSSRHGTCLQKSVLGHVINFYIN